MNESNLDVDRFATAALIVSVAAAGLFLWRYHGLELDDGYVALHMGSNWARGFGMIFNPTDAGGISRGLPHALIAGLAASLGLAGIGLLRFISVISFALVLLASGWIARAAAGARAGVSTVVFLLPSAALIYWATSGADVALVSLCLTGAAALFVLERQTGRWRGSALLFVLAAIARPWFAAAYVLWRLLADRGATDAMVDASIDRATARRRDLTLFLIGFGAFLLWRWLEWGTPLFGQRGAPIEVNVAAGFEELDRWVRSYPFLAGMLAWPLLRLWRRDRDGGVDPAPALRDVYVLALLIVIGGAMTGASRLPFHAPFVMAMPLLAVLLAALPQVLGVPSRPIWVLAIASAVWGGFNADEEWAQTESRRIVEARQVGTWASSQLGAGESIATATPGTVAYYSHRRTFSLRDGIDVPRPSEEFPPPNGRTEAVLQGRPTVVVFGAPLESHRPSVPVEDAVFDHPLFRFFYRARVAERGEEAAIHYYRFDDLDAPLWRNAWSPKADYATDLVAAASEAWKLVGPPLPPDEGLIEALKAEVDSANQAIQSKDYERARQLLEAMLERNRRAQLPQVGNALGYLGLMQGDIPRAIEGYKEQVRYDPDSDVKQGHLRMFLRIRQEELDKGRVR